MIITVTASTLKGAPLTATELDAVLEGGAMMERLDEARARIVDYVTGRMGMVAPNLSKVVGATCAALLMGAAGGLLALSKVPSCNVSVCRGGGECVMCAIVDTVVFHSYSAQRRSSWLACRR